MNNKPNNPTTRSKIIIIIFINMVVIPSLRKDHLATKIKKIRFVRGKISISINKIIIMGMESKGLRAIFKDF